MNNDKEHQKKKFERGILLSKGGAVFNSLLSTFAFATGLNTIGVIFFISILLFLIGWWSNEEGLKTLEKSK